MKPAAGHEMIRSMEPNNQYGSVLGCQDFKIEPGDSLGYRPRDPAGRDRPLVLHVHHRIAGTWQKEPFVHLTWKGKSDLNDPSIRTYRVYRADNGGRGEPYAEAIGRYALVKAGKLGDRFAVLIISHTGQEGPPDEIEVTQTRAGPGQAFHLRTGSEDSAK